MCNGKAMDRYVCVSTSLKEFNTCLQTLLSASNQTSIYWYAIIVRLTTHFPKRINYVNNLHSNLSLETPFIAHYTSGRYLLIVWVMSQVRFVHWPSLVCKITLQHDKPIPRHCLYRYIIFSIEFKKISTSHPSDYAITAPCNINVHQVQWTKLWYLMKHNQRAIILQCPLYLCICRYINLY